MVIGAGNLFNPGSWDGWHNDFCTITAYQKSDIVFLQMPQWLNYRPAHGVYGPTDYRYDGSL